MENFTLRMKMLVGGVLLVLVPMVILGSLTYLRATTAVENEAFDKSLHIAQRLADMTQAVMEEEVKLVRSLTADGRLIAALETLSKGEKEQATKELSEVMANFNRMNKMWTDEYEAILVTDDHGKVVADNTGGGYVGIDLSQRRYFKEVTQKGGSVGDVVLSKKTNGPVASIAAEVKSSSAAMIGMVAMIMKTDFLVEKISGTRLGKTGYGWMVNESGSLIAHPVPENLLTLNLADLEGMKNITDAMLAGKTGVTDYVFKGTKKVCGYAPVPLTGWSIGATQNTEEFLAPVIQIRNWIILTTGMATIAACIIVLVFVLSITRTINTVAESLRNGAEEVASAANQIASASQSLAETSSEQAATQEETSASIEQISATAKETTELTRDASNLMNENIAKTAQSLKALKKLSGNMASIENDSSKIGTVTKTIDEIAFQTNLLALNAAVEAARAGEAGAGFAVVAEEVRNLALRASEAANGTQELLEGMRAQIVTGAESLRSMSVDFEGIVESATVMGEQTSAITEASRQQSQGIDQISQATLNVDQATQAVAANSEETAAASEELASQAEIMLAMVKTLAQLVHGQKKELKQRSIRQQHTVDDYDQFDEIAAPAHTIKKTMRLGEEIHVRKQQ
ncbi:methyl-accepting chemotaxis protein [Desulfocicer niacini]